jgi:prepilin-type processing-associated H-X9-DG protein
MSRYPSLKLDHTYAMNCAMCHAKDMTKVRSPSRTAFILESTNLPQTTLGAIIYDGTTRMPLIGHNQPGFRHNQRVHIVMADSHLERMNAQQYKSASKFDEFWFPNERRDVGGNP